MDNRFSIFIVTANALPAALAILQETDCELHLKRGIPLPDDLKIRPVYFDTLSDHITSVFGIHRGMIFIMSLGIVVRVLAPHVKSKYSDPAVVTLDESARYAISTLSGHEGGANKLACLVSSITGAEPVITTATESARLYTCGTGCKRGTSCAEIVSAIKKSCDMAGIQSDDIRSLSTAWIKKDEPGIAEAANELGLSLRFIPKSMIEHFYAVNPEMAEKSPFVYEKIGVHGVCEPCALIDGRNAVLILEKTSFGGVTVSIARENLFPFDAKRVEKPKGRVLLLGGTVESVKKAEELKALGVDFLISTATEYGYDLFKERFGESVIIESFQQDSLSSFIERENIETIVDCTHPYALKITETAKTVCRHAGIEYKGMSRVVEESEVAGDHLFYADSFEHMIEIIKSMDVSVILFTTGSGNLEWKKELSELKTYVRVLPYEESIKKCLAAGIGRESIIAMHGPFTKNLNKAIIEQFKIECLVTKLTGKEGGFQDKTDAAVELGIPVVVVKKSG